MNEEVFHNSIRKLLRRVGVTSQQELEKAVEQGIKSGQLKGDESFSVTIRVESDLLEQPHIIEGQIDLA